LETIKQILKSLTLLYAEDNDDIRESTLKTLKIFFKEVYPAKDGVEALRIYNKTTINVLLLDYVMPNIDGYELAMEIRKINKSIPIVICSGYTDKDKLLNAIKIGVINYIEKPLRFNDFMNTMNKVVEILKKENLLTINILKILSYNYINKVLIKNGVFIPLSKKEIILVEYLLNKRSQLSTQEELLSELFEEETDINNLRNIIYRLKKKVDLNFIVTIKDLGYMIV
jgi:DNA-binding response OmpR family regulator